MRSRLHQLIEDYENDALTEEDELHFLELLKNDPEVRREYLDHFHLSAFLRQQARNRRLFSPDVRSKAESAATIRRRLKVSVVSAFACVAVLGMMFFLVHLNKPSALLSLRSSPGSSYAVTKPDGEAASSGTDQMNGAGSIVEISQGTLELTSESGTRSILCGPARLELNGPDQLFLHHGTIYCEMGGKTRGAFTLNTGSLRIVDTGTAFGVIRPEDPIVGNEEVHVAKGAVRITVKSTGETVEARAGDSFRLEFNRKLLPLPTRKDSFITRLPDTLPYIHWGFDESDGEKFPSSGPLAGNAGFPMEWRKIRGNANFENAKGPGRFGGALVLHGSGDYGASEWGGISGRAPRSISLWMKIPVSDQGSSIEALEDKSARRNAVSWGIRAWSPQSASWEIDFPSKPGLGKVLATKYAIGEEDVYTRQSLADDNWHHVVSVFNGTIHSDGVPSVVHYVDGKEIESFHMDPVSTSPFGTQTQHPLSQPLRVGIAAVPIFKDLATFEVAIDELRVFAAALTPEQVEGLFAENKLPALR